MASAPFSYAESSTGGDKISVWTCGFTYVSYVIALLYFSLFSVESLYLYRLFRNYQSAKRKPQKLFLALAALNALGICFFSHANHHFVVLTHPAHAHFSVSMCDVTLRSHTVFFSVAFGCVQWLRV